MEADDFMVSDKILTRLIEEVNTGGIRRIAVGDESWILISRSGANSFVHGDGSR